MRALVKYSFANAKVRAMLSRLPDGPFFERLADAESFAEALELLRTSRILEPTGGPGNASDLRDVERRLLLGDIATHRTCRDILAGRKEKEFVSLLMERYEIEEVKAALRILPDGDSAARREFLPPVVRDIPYRAIAAAPSLEKAAALLAGTPYAEPVAATVAHGVNASFTLDAALDAGYYRRLLEAARRFTKLDRQVSLKMLGIEIDIENVLLLIRGHRYYPFSPRQLAQWILPGGITILPEAVASAKEFEHIFAAFWNVRTGPYIPAAATRGNPDLLAAALEQALGEAVRATLRGFPFTVGAVTGYLFLKRRATRRVITILYAKHYRWRREEIHSLITSC